MAALQSKNEINNIYLPYQYSHNSQTFKTSRILEEKKTNKITGLVDRYMWQQCSHLRSKASRTSRSHQTRTSSVDRKHVAAICELWRHLNDRKHQTSLYHRAYTGITLGAHIETAIITRRSISSYGTATTRKVDYTNRSLTSWTSVNLSPIRGDPDPDSRLESALLPETPKTERETSMWLPRDVREHENRRTPGHQAASSTRVQAGHSKLLPSALPISPVLPPSATCLSIAVPRPPGDSSHYIVIPDFSVYTNWSRTIIRNSRSNTSSRHVSPLVWAWLPHPWPSQTTMLYKHCINNQIKNKAWYLQNTYLSFHNELPVNQNTTLLQARITVYVTVRVHSLFNYLYYYYCYIKCTYINNDNVRI